MGLPEAPKEGFEEVVKKTGVTVKGPFYCSFCGRSNKEVKHIVLGGAFCTCREGGEAFTAICGQCALLTIELLIETNDKGIETWIKRLASTFVSSQT